MTDEINHPQHYTYSQIEAIDVIEDWQLGYHLGNVVKYIQRAKHKDSELNDMLKARWYFNRYVDQLKVESDD